MKFGHNTPGALRMCLEHSKVNFDHQGALLASRHDGGTTYGITKVSIVSVQSFKAVASIVWDVRPKDINWSLVWIITMHADNWNILTETSSIVLCLKPVLFLCL